MLLRSLGLLRPLVTGVPERRDDHALAMVRFAREMLYTMKSELLTLKKILGDGTRSLGMRVGTFVCFTLF